MENQQIHSLGTERISKLLLKFSLPCIMGLLISAFYNIVALVTILCLTIPFFRKIKAS